VGVEVGVGVGVGVCGGGGGFECSRHFSAWCITARVLRSAVDEARERQKCTRAWFGLGFGFGLGLGLGFGFGLGLGLVHARRRGDVEHCDGRPPRQHVRDDVA